MFSNIQPSNILVCLLFAASYVQSRNFFFIDGQKETLSRVPHVQAAPNKHISIPFLMKAQKQTEKGSVPAVSLASALVASIGVGSPPQQLSMLLDTGSNLFWVRSTKCTSGFCAGKPMFNSESSSSFQQGPSSKGTSLSDSIVYADGTSVQCTVNQDTVSFGDFQVKNQNICEATFISTTTSETDGLIGIGPPNGLKSSADFMRNFDSQFSTSVLAFSYNQNFNKEGASGEITLGGLNPDRYNDSSPIVWAPIADDRRLWFLTLTGVKNSTNDSILFGKSGVSIPVVMDTGTTSNLLPEELAAAINAQIGAKLSPEGLYTLDCDATNIQTLSLTFNGNAAITLSGSQFIFRPPFSSECYSIFQPYNGVIPVFGAWFLRNFYTVFDYQKARIGFGIPKSF